MKNRPAYTLDEILGGKLTIVQPAAGYRFAVDSILLGRFAKPRHGSRILELGAGSGVIALLLATLHRPREVAAVELQPELATMISENASRNGLSSVTPVCADIRERAIPALAPASFDYVVVNPPYRALRAGRESPDPQRRIARGGDGASLREFITAAAAYAKPSARLAIVFTASRTAELIDELRRRSFEPKRIRFVHPLPARPAALILVEARKGGGLETIIEPPLFLHERPRVYSSEAQELLGRGKGQPL